MDHDQRFKELIKTFFAEFLELFFVEWAERLDARSVEWLDKEVFPDPPDGARRILDLVAKLPTRQSVPGVAPGEAENWLALVHIEIESPDRAKPLRQRMQQSYGFLRHKYGFPVLPIALYLRVGLEGIGVDVYEEKFWEFETLRFRYLYVGLPALDAIKYVQGENWLGVALSALMRIPREKVTQLGTEALQRIMGSPLSDQQRFLLAECVQAYLPLDDEQAKLFEQLLMGESFQGLQAMNTTWYEKGLEQGLEKGLEQGLEQGRLQGQRELLRSQLENGFGPLSEETRKRIQSLTADELARIARIVIKAKTLRELGLD